MPNSRPAGTVATHLATTSALIAAADGPADMRRRLGAWALTQPGSDPAAQQRWRRTVAARLPSQAWPSRQLLVTAVDADTGEPIGFDQDSGVELVDAVAASCSGASAYTIAGHRYIDGGTRSNADNADLAAGADRVLVLSPLGGRSRTPAGKRPCPVSTPRALHCRCGWGWLLCVVGSRNLALEAE